MSCIVTTHDCLDTVKRPLRGQACTSLDWTNLVLFIMSELRNVAAMQLCDVNATLLSMIIYSAISTVLRLRLATTIITIRMHCMICIYGNLDKYISLI